MPQSIKNFKKSAFQKYLCIYITPILYSSIILLWEYTGYGLYLFFSEYSLIIYKFIYSRKGKILEVLPFADLNINLTLCWLFIFLIICSLFFMVKNKDFRKGIKITLAMHIVLFFIVGIYIFQFF